MSQSSLNFTATGPVAPDASAVRAAVASDWQAAFGNDLNLDPATPQGQLITSLTAIIQEKNAQLLFLSSQLNPDTAEGVWQDALGRIYFLDRQPARPTVVQCVCTGVPGVVIPGLDGYDYPALADDAQGRRYLCQQGGPIGPDGTTVLPFEAQNSGPEPCPAHTLSAIVRAIPGWDTIDNPEPGATGRNVEGRAAFEARRRASVARNANGSLRAVYANVAALDGVLDCLTRENTGDVPVAIGSVELAPHSLYVCVAGGEDSAIALAIAERKSAGCAMNGNTAHEVADARTGARQIIRWERPMTVRCGVRVLMAATASTPADIVGRVREAVLAAFSGDDGGQRAGLGGTVYASRFYGGVIAAGVTELVNVRVTAPCEDTESIVWQEAVTLEINQYPTLAAEDISVNINVDMQEA